MMGTGPSMRCATSPARVAVAIAALSQTLILPVAAQAPPTSLDLRFDVASVKPNPQTAAEYMANLRALILRAYDIKEYQLEGGPAWINTARFEIDAKATGEPTAQEFNAMLKALLVERFALRTRIEVRQLPRYVLTLARSDGSLGSSLTPTSAACLDELDERKRNPGQRSVPAPLLPRARSRLSSDLNAPVVDETGLTGLYDWVLQYEPLRRSADLAALRASRDFASPPLKSALQQQLGLRLEEVKGPLDVIVIESVGQPTPN